MVPAAARARAPVLRALCRRSPDVSPPNRIQSPSRLHRAPLLQAHIFVRSARRRQRAVITAGPIQVPGQNPSWNRPGTSSPDQKKLSKSPRLGGIFGISFTYLGKTVRLTPYAVASFVISGATLIQRWSHGLLARPCFGTAPRLAGSYSSDGRARGQRGPRRAVRASASTGVPCAARPASQSLSLSQRDRAFASHGGPCRHPNPLLSPTRSSAALFLALLSASIFSLAPLPGALDPAAPAALRAPAAADPGLLRLVAAHLLSLCRDIFGDVETGVPWFLACLLAGITGWRARPSAPRLRRLVASSKCGTLRAPAVAPHASSLQACGRAEALISDQRARRRERCAPRSAR